jgi:hypothetical protein
MLSLNERTHACVGASMKQLSCEPDRSVTVLPEKEGTGRTRRLVCDGDGLRRICTTRHTVSRRGWGKGWVHEHSEARGRLLQL